MGRRLDYDRVAAILVEALYYGDQETAKRWDITTRTIQNYRARLDDDAELSVIFADKKAAFETEWANEVPAALRSAVRFLMRAGEEADPSDPQAIHAVAGALKMLAEVRFTKDILDARLSEFYRQNGIQSGPLVAEEQRQLTD